MVIRWLGAFRYHGASFHDSLRFEFSRRDEVAAEIIRNDGYGSEIRASVGLLVHPGAVRVTFRADVWSEYDQYGRLYKTRKPGIQGHTEAWCAPVYTGIVIKGNLRKKIWRTVRWFAKRKRLPIFRLTPRGKLVTIVPAE